MKNLKTLTQVLCIPLVFIVGWFARDWQTGTNPSPAPPVETAIIERPIVTPQPAAVERSITELVKIVASLGDPHKLASLKTESAAADRLVKMCFHLHEGKEQGIAPEEVTALCLNEWELGAEAGKATESAILNALAQFENFGCFDLETDRSKLRKGKRPTIRKGDHEGEIVHIDHIVPRAEASNLTQVLANLRPVAASVNQSKGARLHKESILHWNYLKSIGLGN